MKRQFVKPSGPAYSVEFNTRRPPPIEPSLAQKVNIPYNIGLPAPKKKTGKDFWGPHIWATIHTLAISLKPENVIHFKRFMESLVHLLPCAECRANLAKKLSDNPIDRYMTNNMDAFYYTYLIHDLANKDITSKGNGPKYSPDFEEIKRHYLSSIGEDCKHCSA